MCILILKRFLFISILLTFSLGFFPVCLINVDVPGEAKIRDFTDLVQGQKHVSGCQVAVDQLELA